MNERLKELRKHLDLSQEEFGLKIGVTKASISRLESGTNNFTEKMIKSICREFGVNYMWFASGEGEMFLDVSSAILNRLADEYNLTDDDKEIIESYINLDVQSRSVLVNYLKGVFKK